jgi:hypothetical protein
VTRDRRWALSLSSATFPDSGEARGTDGSLRSGGRQPARPLPHAQDAVGNAQRAPVGESPSSGGRRHVAGEAPRGQHPGGCGRETQRPVMGLGATRVTGHTLRGDAGRSRNFGSPIWPTTPECPRMPWVRIIAGTHRGMSRQMARLAALPDDSGSQRGLRCPGCSGMPGHRHATVAERRSQQALRLV